MIDDRLIDEAVERAVAPEYFEPCYAAHMIAHRNKRCLVEGVVRLRGSESYHAYFVACEACAKKWVSLDYIGSGKVCVRDGSYMDSAVRVPKHLVKDLERKVGKRMWPGCIK